MSIKIYRAWRVPASRLNEYFDWARERMKKVVLDHLEQKVLPTADIKEALEKGPPEHLKEVPGWVENWEKGQRFKAVQDKLLEASKSNLRDPYFDVDCGLNVWLQDDYAYKIPVSEHWIAASLDSGPEVFEWVEDYSYWNNTDGPEEISEADWDAREEKWYSICIDVDHNQHRMFHTVYDLDGPMGVWELEMDVHLRKAYRFADECQRLRGLES
jgi:hypothetical protein